ncbi:MAG: ComEA family DNA-binding protein [Clostridia bacterium]|nr:ComEA family DNA-binding protein [Clostridia bacterium]
MPDRTAKRERNENLTAIVACAATAVFLALVLVLWAYSERHGTDVAFRVSAATGVTDAAKERLSVNINAASADELEKLPGIGEKKAAAIVAYREEHGAFAAVEEIVDVPGIGDGLFEKLREYITVEEEGK